MLFRREAVIPVWLVVFGLFALFGSSTTFATGVFVLLLGTLALTIMQILWKAPPNPVHQVEEHRDHIERLVRTLGGCDGGDASWSQDARRRTG